MAPMRWMGELKWPPEGRARIQQIEGMRRVLIERMASVPSMKRDRELLREPIKNVNELRESLARFVFSELHAGRHARVDVVLEDGQADSVESGFGRRQLLKNFNAQARFLHHAPDASDLPLDSVQSGDERLLLRCIKHGSQLRFSYSPAAEYGGNRTNV